MALAEKPAIKLVKNDSPCIDVINPISQELVGQIPIQTPAEVQAVFERARTGQKNWAALSVKERTRFVQRWLDLLWKKQAEGIRILRSENGKTEGSAFLEFMWVDAVAQYYVHHAPRILNTQRRRTIFPLIQWAKLHFKPIGVVGIISPWNYPFALPFGDMIPALIAGNSIVFKPSEFTPFVAEFAVNLMYDAGIPRDVVQIVHGDGKTGGAVVDNADFIQFTGSTDIGRKVAVRCAERMIPYSMELGGKDPAIVLKDADPKEVAIALIQGKFENSGQMCISIARVYIEEEIYDKVIEQLLIYLPKMKIGNEDGLDVAMGTMARKIEFDRVQAHVEDAVAKGAKVLYGGKPRPDLGALFFEPTVLVDVDHSMQVIQEETFGPIMPIIKVKDAQEAVQWANESHYGLSASIFSKNFKHAEALALEINSGDVCINRAQYAIGTPGLPTGGQKFSGVGRRNGPEGILKYTAYQGILTDNLLDKLLEPEDSLVIGTPLVTLTAKTLHHIRRYVPFI